MRQFIPFSLVLALAASPATAQGTSQERSDCMGDALRFCSADIPDVDEIEACLQQNMARLSPACRREFAPASSTKLKPEHFQ